MKININHNILIVAIATVTCFLIYAFCPRYSIVSTQYVAYKIDRWTGKTYLIVGGHEKLVEKSENNN